MKRFLSYSVISALLILLLILDGCTLNWGISEQTKCKQACRFELKQCHSICHNNSQQCHACANANALKSYIKYQHQQCVQGKALVRELQSYRDPLQCKKTTCDCYADYRMCNQACTGLIQKRLQVP